MEKATLLLVQLSFTICYSTASSVRDAQRHSCDKQNRHSGILGYVEYLKSGQAQGDVLLVVLEGDFAVRLGNKALIKQKVKVSKGRFYSITFSAARTCAQEEKLNVSISPNSEEDDDGIIPMQTLYSSSGWDSYAWGFQAEAEEVEISIDNPGMAVDPACGPLIESVALKVLHLPKGTGDHAPAERLKSLSSEDVAVYKEPSMYDSLLVSLKSSNKSFSDAHERRQRQEEGRSDSEEDDIGGLESDAESQSEEDGSDEGSDEESPGEHASESELLDSNVLGGEDEDVDTETGTDNEGLDSDEEDRLEGPSDANATATDYMRSLNAHLGHNLSKEEVDDLSKKRWKYKWDMPAIDMSNCKWTGTGECFLKDDSTSSAYGLKPSLYKHWLNIYKTSGGSDFHMSKERLFFSLCESYRDILHCNKKPFYHKGHREDSSIMDAYIMHSLNHIFRTRDLVTKNNAKKAKLEEAGNEELLFGDCFRDHGFTRPKVLILLPLRSIALRVVKRLIQLTPSNRKVNVEHMDRFTDDFGGGEAEDNDDGALTENVPALTQKSSKPSDYHALFDGNNDDHFMIGIKFTRRSIRLYSDFYTSDMIVASPLGLTTKIGEADSEKEKDVDYLSSIEVLIVDHADVIAMQNWSLVDEVVQRLNQLPSKQHGTDIMRIRHWYLDEYARFYRQSIILGYYLNPDINALFNHQFINYKGKVKLVCDYKGVLPKVVLQVKQIYQRFDAKSIEEANDARFEYFTQKVFPKIKDSVQGGIMLFASSYFEYVRIRNFLKSQNASFCLLGDYTKQSDISRSRVWFFEGRRKIMLYTERAHFYHRYKIRGIQNLIIYSLPERKEFYPEIVNMLNGSDIMTCTVLFSKFDQLRLERIVGSLASKRMVTSEKGVFVFS
ncbi:hypothetical protein CDL15_Pgr016012 [Punica granatum]|uniref:Uncharacterized protein n=2 Tax=Magnoliopsida TaxID=3398 RepID=A0A218XQN7_PUNGR|nr:hypothetical protein CDL15_Pgr016012 [Punica granatum]